LFEISRCASTLAWFSGEAFGLVNQRKLLLFFFQHLLKLVGLGLDLPLVGLAGRADRQPFAERHRAGACQQARQTGDEDCVRREIGAGHAHHEAQIRTEPVIGAQHRGAQGITAESAMPALQAGDRWPAESAGRWRCQGLDDAGMRSLGRRQSAGNGLRLGIVGAAVHLLEGIDGRQYEGWTEAARQPCERARPKARLQPRHSLIDRCDFALPEFGVSLLHGPQASVTCAKSGFFSVSDKVR
jgi:hypothetical protein